METFETGLNALYIMIFLQAIGNQRVEYVSLNVFGHFNLKWSTTVRRCVFMEWMWPCGRKCVNVEVGLEISNMLKVPDSVLAFFVLLVRCRTPS